MGSVLLVLVGIGVLGAGGAFIYKAIAPDKNANSGPPVVHARIDYNSLHYHQHPQQQAAPPGREYWPIHPANPSDQQQPSYGPLPQEHDTGQLPEGPSTHGRHGKASE